MTEVEKAAIRQIKAASDILTEARKHTHMREGVGGRWLGVCPMHGGRGFQVDRTPQTFHCFGCNAHGDVIDLARLARGVSFNSALAILAASAGVTLPP